LFSGNEMLRRDVQTAAFDCAEPGFPCTSRSATGIQSGALTAGVAVFLDTLKQMPDSDHNPTVPPRSPIGVLIAIALLTVVACWLVITLKRT
jgi:hypothetical protein